MVNFLIKKIVYSFLVIFGVLTIVFFLFNILPGDPARMMLDKREDSKQLEIIKKKYGFDKPVFTQYCYYLNDLSFISIHSKNPNSFTFLDDQKYANALASSLKRRGLAKSAARQKLRQKRVGASHIDEALNQSYMQTDEMQIDPNLYAAARAAQKKRLGPWGPENIDYPTLQKQLAKLARRGFSYGIAKQVLQSSLEEAEQWLLDGDL